MRKKLPADFAILEPASRSRPPCIHRLTTRWPVTPSDWLRIAELVVTYRDLPLGAADASVITAAERLGVRQVATLDRRHFSVVRPRHVDALELLP